MDGTSVWWGAVAQLGERLVRNEEVSGSIPLSSTKTTTISKRQMRRIRPLWRFCAVACAIPLQSANQISKVLDKKISFVLCVTVIFRLVS